MAPVAPLVSLAQCPSGVAHNLWSYSRPRHPTARSASLQFWRRSFALIWSQHVVTLCKSAPGLRTCLPTTMRSNGRNIAHNPRVVPRTTARCLRPDPCSTIQVRHVRAWRAVPHTHVLSYSAYVNRRDEHVHAHAHTTTQALASCCTVAITDHTRTERCLLDRRYIRTSTDLSAMHMRKATGLTDRRHRLTRF